MIGQLLYHIFALTENGYGLYYDLFIVQYPESEYMWHDKLGGNLKFLTTQNMLIQTVYFLLAAFNDLMGTNEPDVYCNLPAIRLLRDFYFTGLSFPLAILVSYFYWSLFFFKRNTVSPTVFDAVVPRWLNHVEHTAVSVLAFIEMFICFRTYPDLRTGLSIIYSYGVFYLIWLHLVKHFKGYWIYPVFNNLSNKKHCTFICIILLNILLSYLFCELINNAYWSYELNYLAYGRQTRMSS